MQPSSPPSPHWPPAPPSEPDNVIDISPMRWADIPRLVQGSYDGLRNDSHTRYYEARSHCESVDFEPAVRELRGKLGLRASLSDVVHLGTGLTVNHGDAMLVYRRPGDHRSGPYLRPVVPLLERSEPEKLRKRKREFVHKLNTLLENTLGYEIEDMFELQMLGTTPAKQGRGYATALVNVLHDMADEMDRAIYVVTGDARGFYKTVGYQLLGEDWLGVDDPDWQGGPVPLRIMVRPPVKSFAKSMDSHNDLARRPHSS